MQYPIHKFQTPGSKQKKTFQVTVGMVLLLFLIAAAPPVTLFVMGLIYVLSGPFGAAYRTMNKTKKGAEEQAN